MHVILRPARSGIRLFVAFLVGFAILSPRAAFAEEPEESRRSWRVRSEGSSIHIEAGTGSRYVVPGVPESALISWTPGQPARWVTPPPPSVPVGCTGQLLSGQWVDDACPLLGLPTAHSEDDPEAPAFVPPSTIDIIYQALASTTVPGAGLVVQPEGTSYTGIPALVHASRTTHQIPVTVLGRQTSISLSARTYSFDFGDGTAPLVTTSPGAPYPDRTNQHTYTSPAAAHSVELVTTWTAVATNPFTGETRSVEGVLQTREASVPFEVRKSHTVLTDTAEERLGH